MLHTLRVEGNRATHGFRPQHREAMDGLKIGRALAIGYHQSFGRRVNLSNPSAGPTPYTRPIINSKSRLIPKVVTHRVVDFW
ncbi:hypothetical protein [Pseudomonas marginalis]|uniref:hypothetical protein n=1 Tax=Pseudomonas fluorescens group TaxID=136843 RepID=UPI0039907DC4